MEFKTFVETHSQVDISFHSHVDVSFTGGGSFTSTGPVHIYMSRSHVEDPVTRRDPVHRLVLAVRGPPRVICTSSCD